MKHPSELHEVTIEELPRGPLRELPRKAPYKRTSQVITPNWNFAKYPRRNSQGTTLKWSFVSLGLTLSQIDTDALSLTFILPLILTLTMNHTYTVATLALLLTH